MSQVIVIVVLFAKVVLKKDTPLGHTDYESKVEILLKVVGVRTVDVDENGMRKSQSEWAIQSPPEPSTSIRQSFSDSALTMSSNPSANEQFKIFAGDRKPTS